MKAKTAKTRYLRYTDEQVTAMVATPYYFREQLYIAACRTRVYRILINFDSRYPHPGLKGRI